MFDVEARRKEKMRSNDRVLVLEVIDGTKPKTATGLTDSRLFSGEENDSLHAVQSPTGLWTCKYSRSTLPEPLRQTFTSFNRLREYVDGYYNRRNLRIAKVID